jgi:MFS transporter, DHA3 family, macrolide efflux protein
MRTFIILWLGQLVSAIGSAMTYFALTLWVWERTQSATAIALILVFYQLPQVAIALFSGLLIDRIPRKLLLIISDGGSACCTISVGILAALQVLHVWQIYLIAAIIGCFGNLQTLTYATLVPLLVPPQHHTRASSLGAMVGYGAGIVSPALAGVLYPSIGLLGITAVDGGTFAIAILTLLLVNLPTLTRTQTPGKFPKKFWHEVTFGFRYLAEQPSLLAMVGLLAAFTFLHQMGETLYQPMILARTGGDAQLLGLVVAASGIGGVVGAITFSLWGGFRQRIIGMLVGIVGTGLSELLLGLGSLPSLWMVARFGTSFHGPLIVSSYMAVWYTRVASELQGRVFAADYLIGTLVELSANLAAGPLADRLFEPWMQTNTSILTDIFGMNPGSGMALLHALLALGILMVGAVGLSLRRLKSTDKR